MIPSGSSIDRFPRLMAHAYAVPPGVATLALPFMQPWSETPQNGDLNHDNQITPTDAAIALAIAAGGFASY